MRLWDNEPATGGNLAALIFGMAVVLALAVLL